MCGVWQKTHASLAETDRTGADEVARKSCLVFMMEDLLMACANSNPAIAAQNKSVMEARVHIQRAPGAAAVR